MVKKVTNDPSSASKSPARRPAKKEKTETSAPEQKIPTAGVVAQSPLGGYARDRIVLMTRDPYWLHAYWEITGASIAQAQAALREEWKQPAPRLILKTEAPEFARLLSQIRRMQEMRELQRWTATCIVETNKAAENAT